MHRLLGPFVWYLHTSWKKKIGIAFLAVIILVIALNYLLPKQSGYVMGKVEKTPLTEVVTESGTLLADSQTDIYSPTTGVVQSVMVENGASVSAGQTLFIVKSTATEQEQQAAYTAYLAAQSEYNQADATANTLRSAMYVAWKAFMDMATSSDYENSNDTPKQKERLESAAFQSTQDNWLASEKSYKNHEVLTSAAQAKMNTAWLAYQATQNATVKATTYGTVSNLSIAQGSKVQAYSPTSIPRPALTLVTNPKIIGVVDFGQSDIAKIQPGQEVVILPDAYKDKTYSGVVERVDTMGRSVQGVVKYTVYVGITVADVNLRSGMSMDAQITTKKLTDVLTVPNAAIVLYQGKKSVRVLNAQKQMIYVPVEVGVKGQSRTQILSGLKENQEIIVSLTNELIQRPSLLGI